MAGTRVQVDLFFKGKTPAQVNRAFPQLLPAIKGAKAKASTVGDEMTVRAVFHVCRHDEGKPCDPEQEI